MKIILQDYVETLGEEGDVLEVADGYARNYLLPRGLAVKATPQNLKQLEKVIEAREERKKEEIEKAQDLANSLAEISLVFKVKVGEKGKLFGSVTNDDIAKMLKEKHDIDIDKRKVEMKNPIKEVGFYVVPVKLHAEVHSDVRVQVEAEQEEEKKNEEEVEEV